MRIKKILVSLAVIICLGANANAVAFADTTVPFVDDEISLAYEIAEYTNSTLSIINGTAYCDSSTKGKDAVSVLVTQTLQKHKSFWIWDDVDGAEWTGTSAYNSICLSNSKSGLENGTYRVKSVFVLTDKKGKSETITTYSNEKKYHK
ncbi:MAG: hypothetical protein OSJ43_15775 [Oscillospiraceae bacterium]|nr:hypothetical protein [Oscillospiraceae bacterium]